MHRFGILKTPGASSAGLREALEAAGHAAVEINLIEASPASLDLLFKIFEPEVLIGFDYHALVPANPQLQAHHRELEAYFTAKNLPIIFLFERGPLEVHEDEFHSRWQTKRLYSRARFLTQSPSSAADFPGGATLYRPGVIKANSPETNLSFQFTSTLSYFGEAYCQPETRVIGDPELRIVHRDGFLAHLKFMAERRRLPYSDAELLPLVIQFLAEDISSATAYHSARRALEQQLAKTPMYSIFSRSLGTLSDCFDGMQVASFLRRLAPDHIRVFGGPGWKQLLGLPFEAPLVPTEHLPALFQFSKINLFPHRPSRDDSYDRRALSCMALGQFALLPRIPIWTQIFDPASHFFFSSSDEVLDRVRYWEKHEEERLSIAERQRITVEREFSWTPAVSAILRSAESF